MIQKAMKWGGGILALIVGFILAGFIVLWAKGKYDAGVVERARAEAGISARDTSIVALQGRQAVTDTVYRERVREYPVFRDRLIQANPGNQPLADLAARCDQLILSCDARIAVADTLADSLRAQVKALREMKEKKPPRFSAFALAGYDWLNSEPLAQGGVDFRIVGPLSATAFLETGGTKSLKELETRAVIAAKFTFR